MRGKHGSQYRDAQGAADLARLGCASILAWLIGYVSLITPGGVGVREASFVLLTAPWLSQPEAMLISLIQRVLWTIVDGALGGPTLLWSLHSMRTQRAPRNNQPAP